MTITRRRGPITAASKRSSKSVWERATSGRPSASTPFAATHEIRKARTTNAIRASHCQKAISKRLASSIQIGSHVNGANLDDPALFPVFEAAAALGAAVFVHPWEMLGRDRMGKYWLPWLVGMPAETALAICSVIFGGVLERLPELRIGFAHGGGGFPFSLGRIEHGFKVRPDLCATESSTPPRDMVRRFYVDSLVHDEDALRSLIQLVGENAIALGSDYPFGMGDARPPGTVAALPHASDADKDAMYGGNAVRVFGLDEALAV